MQRMASAKELIVKPIKSDVAARLVKKVHYSGKVVQNSQLHFGVFLSGKLEGAMSFGPSLDKRKIQGLVKDTKWNSFLELNRMAFTDNLPRNSESRAMSVAFRLIKKHYPHIEWIISFADASQCGDGAIYRAAGFFLTGIRPNNQIIQFPDGLIETRLVLTNARKTQGGRRNELAKKYGIKVGGGSSLKPFFEIGCKPLPGYQVRYIYFLNKEAKNRLTVPILPFSEITRNNANMYKGKASHKG
jgi:hypothetical protein